VGLPNKTHWFSFWGEYMPGCLKPGSFAQPSRVNMQGDYSQTLWNSPKIPPNS